MKKPKLDFGILEISAVRLNDRSGALSAARWCKAVLAGRRAIDSLRPKAAMGMLSKSGFDLLIFGEDVTLRRKGRSSFCDSRHLANIDSRKAALAPPALSHVLHGLPRAADVDELPPVMRRRA